MKKKMMIALLCGAILIPNSIKASDITSTTENGTSQAVINQQAARFSVTVPIALYLNSKPNGESEIGRAQIINNSDGPVQVVDVGINATNGWEVIDFNSDFKAIGFDENQIGLSLNGGTTTDTGYDFDSSNFPIMNTGEALDLEYQSRIPVRTTSISNETVAEVVFMLDWVKDEQLPVEPVEGYINIAGKEYSFNDGSTFEEWVISSNDREEYIVKDGNVFVKDSLAYISYDSKGKNPVKSTDKVELSQRYYLYDPSQWKAFMFNGSQIDFGAAINTWKDFTDSEYNTDGFYYDEDFVYSKDGLAIVLDGNYVIPNDSIINKEEYGSKEAIRKFYIGETEYNFEKNETWQSWVGRHSNFTVVGNRVRLTSDVNTYVSKSSGMDWIVPSEKIAKDQRYNLVEATITFKIDSNSYTAYENMTWEEFIGSKFNTHQFANDGTYIKTDGGQAVCLGDTYIKPTDKILAWSNGTNYTTKGIIKEFRLNIASRWKYEDGMTWREFVNSDYSKNKFYILEDNVIYLHTSTGTSGDGSISHHRITDYSDNKISPDSKILLNDYNTHYITRYEIDMIKITSGHAYNYFNVGDQLYIGENSYYYLFDVIGKDHDGKGTITVAINNSNWSDQLNPSTIGNNDYPNSYIRGWLNNYFYTKWPNKVIDSIIPVTKETKTWQGESRTIKDKIWLLSSTEVGVVESHFIQEGNTYEFFKDSSNRIRFFDNTVAEYWLRTPSSTSSNESLYITFNNKVGIENTYVTKALIFGMVFK